MKKIGFLYTNKNYSIYHSLGLAIEMAKYKAYDVHILCVKANESVVLEYLEMHNCSNINIKILRPYWYFTIPHYLEIKLQWKPMIMYRYASLFETFDAFVFTMYDDLNMKKHLKNSSHIKFIFSNHGISNRAYSFDERITAFDLFFLLDKNDKEIREKLNQLTPHNNALTGFIKYDLIKDLPLKPLFKNDKPIVIYNPHWVPEFSSFHKFGQDILEFFANSEDYNLIFAPHYLLLSRNWALRPIFKKYEKYDNIIVDTTSEKCNNMTYTRIADFYLGDISSQVFEFLFEKAKPCLFIDAHNIANDEKDRPLSWDLGKVISNVSAFGSNVKEAFNNHQQQYLSKQEDTMKEMFDVGPQLPTEIGAKAIDNLLKYQSGT